MYNIVIIPLLSFILLVIFNFISVQKLGLGLPDASPQDAFGPRTESWPPLMYALNLLTTFRELRNSKNLSQVVL